MNKRSLKNPKKTQRKPQKQRKLDNSNTTKNDCISINEKDEDNNNETTLPSKKNVTDDTIPVEEKCLDPEYSEIVKPSEKFDEFLILLVRYNRINGENLGEAAESFFNKFWLNYGTNSESKSYSYQDIPHEYQQIIMVFLAPSLCHPGFTSPEAHVSKEEAHWLRDHCLID